MPTKCFTVVRGKRLRVTRLTEHGAVLPPGEPSAFVVTKGFISVGLTAVTEDGEDITQKNADGDLCVNDRSRDLFRRWDLSIELCDVDPALLSMLSNVTVEEDWDGTVVGIRQPEGAAVDTFAAELWTGVPGEEATPESPGSYGYLLLPMVIPGVLGDITVENGASTFSVSGHTQGGGPWGVGPYDVVPTDAVGGAGPLDLPIGPGEHMVLRTTTIDPPAPECGAQAMPEAA